MTDRFTVVSYCTPAFRHFALGLEGDCRRFGYPFHLHEVDREFERLIQAFDYKIEFLQKAVEQFGDILWLDVECRLTRPIPEQWKPPLVSVYRAGKKWCHSTGVLMLGIKDFPILELWHKYAKRYDVPDDFVLDFLHQKSLFSLNQVEVEFLGREAAAPVVRGQWNNQHTIIQHPTVNRWVDPLKYGNAFSGRGNLNQSEQAAVSKKRKKIYYRNFGGEYARVEQWMCSDRMDEILDSGWVFHPKTGRYSPEIHWPDHADNFRVKPFSRALFARQFSQDIRRGEYRRKVISRMRLDSQDCEPGSLSGFLHRLVGAKIRHSRISP